MNTGKSEKLNLEQRIIKFLRNTKVSRNNPRFDKFLADLATYPVLGMTPGRIQDNLGREAGINPTLLTYSSIGYSVLDESAKFFGGFMIAGSSLLGLPGFVAGSLLKGYALYGFAQIGVRTIYAASTKKPIGLLSLEAIDQLNYYMFPENLEHHESEKLYFRLTQKFALQQRYIGKKGFFNKINYFLEDITIMNDYR